MKLAIKKPEKPRIMLPNNILATWAKLPMVLCQLMLMPWLMESPIRYYLRYSNPGLGSSPEIWIKQAPELAIEILQELQAWNLQIELVLTDSLYGESGDVISVLERLKLPFIVAIRSNHGVLVAPGQKVRYNHWRGYVQPLSHRQPETRYIREIIFGKARSIRYYAHQ